MTIVAYIAPNVWIESLDATVALTDAAGRVNGSSIVLSRPGTFLAVSMTMVDIEEDADNIQNIGTCAVVDASGSTLVIGEFVDTILPRVYKAAGTSGNVTVSYNILLIMRKTNTIV